MWTVWTGLSSIIDKLLLACSKTIPLPDAPSSPDRNGRVKSSFGELLPVLWPLDSALDWCGSMPLIRGLVKKPNTCNHSWASFSLLKSHSRIARSLSWDTDQSGEEDDDYCAGDDGGMNWIRCYTWECELQQYIKGWLVKKIASNQKQFIQKKTIASKNFSNLIVC